MKSKEAILTKLNSTFPNLDELGLLQTVDDVFDDLALPPNNKVNVMANLKASLEKYEIDVWSKFVMAGLVATQKTWHD